jgi:hypothetical protein
MCERDHHARPGRGSGACFWDRARTLLVRAITALRRNVRLLCRPVIRLIRLDNAAIASKRAKPTIAHCFADAMHHEPCRLIGDPKRPMQLLGRCALFARVNQVEAHHPFMQRDFRPLHDGARGDGEILPALRLGTTVQASSAFDRIGVIPFTPCFRPVLCRRCPPWRRRARPAASRRLRWCRARSDARSLS